jgi:hypothetical protein
MARDITPVVPHPLLEEDPSVIKAVAERAGEACPAGPRSPRS